MERNFAVVVSGIWSENLTEGEAKEKADKHSSQKVETLRKVEGKYFAVK